MKSLRVINLDCFCGFFLLIVAACLWLQLPALGEQIPATTSSPVAGDGDRMTVTEGNNGFAIALYAQLHKENGNLFFSPESISTSLAMAYTGARGETAAEMAKTLRFTVPSARLQPAMGALLADLNAAHPGYQLRVVDALWAQQGFTFLPEFLKQIEVNYGAGFHQVDFIGATEAARGTINHWIEQKTDDKITDLLQPGVLTPQTKLVLTNAIYFKGDWQTEFDTTLTKIADFHTSQTESVQAPLMHREGGFKYSDGGSFQSLEIPYRSGELSMVIFLPKEVGGLSELEQSMSVANTEQWFKQLKPVPKVIVSFPKFKMTQQFGMSSVLGEMGMPQAFQKGVANFSGMDGKKDLLLSAVIHKAYIDVNEEGTVAAAATAVVMNRAMAMTPIRPQPPVFRADHPFVFLIRENSSGAILFMGRVVDPTKVN